MTPARVGRETDFDRLSLEIWTDGTITPEDALAFAAKILKEQLAIFINFEEPVESHAAAGRRSRRRSTRTCSARWTSSSCRCARRTACRTRTSA